MEYYCLKCAVPELLAFSPNLSAKLNLSDDAEQNLNILID